MPTHKIANDFIKKYNKELAIKGYSRLPVKEKTALIEKRLNEVKSEMITDMKKEWSGITSKYSDKIKKNEAKRANKKKSETKKEEPEKKVKVKVKKEESGIPKTDEQKKNTIGWNKFSKLVEDNKKILMTDKRGRGQPFRDSYDFFTGAVDITSGKSNMNDKWKEFIPILEKRIKSLKDKESKKSSQIVPVKEKEESNQSESLINKQNDIKKVMKSVLTNDLKQAYSDNNKEMMKKLYNQKLNIIAKLKSKYSGKSVSTEKKQLEKMGGVGFAIRKWAEGKTISKVVFMDTDLTDLFKQVGETETKEQPKKKQRVDRKNRNQREREFKSVYKKTVYKVLGLPNKANPSKEELKKICRDLQRQNHPDKGGTTEKIQEINDACAVLMDTIK